jgi:hypothetical protein
MRYSEADRQESLIKVKALAEQFGGLCLSEHFINRVTKLRWKCKKGHEWNAIPLNIEKGHWCSICGNERQGRAKAHSIEMMQELAHQRGGDCLSKTYINNTSKLLWKCEVGHEWMATPGSIMSSGRRKGTWCPICAGKLPPQQAIDELKEIAVKNGGKLISTVYFGVKEQLEWECSFGHKWQAVADSVKHGTWCPICGGSSPLSLDQMKEHAKKYKGECVSEEYVNSRTHLRWRCEAGHEWKAKPDHILKGHWCPTCSTGVSERICRALFEHITGVPFLKHRPKWLKNARNNQMELDGYSEPLNLAFEYHGQQHYQSVAFFHQSSKSLKQRQVDDNEKKRLCQARGITLFEIPFFIPHDELQLYIRSLLEEKDVDLVTNKTYIAIKDLNVWQKQDLDELRKLAVERGGMLLSEHYVNNNTKLRWRCNVGHEWDAVPGSIKSGTWCALCGDKRAAIKRARTIESIKDIAMQNGGACLSACYQNSRSRLRFRCSHGHEWETSASVIVRGHWCPKCQKIRLAKKYALTIESIRATAAARGGRCLSETYINSQQKLMWECAELHTWMANGNSVRRGTWCPICAGKKPI